MAYLHLQRSGAAAARQVSLSLPGSLVVAAVVYLFLLVLGGQLLSDADTYWQIALGRWMMAEGEVPHVDAFSYTMAGKSWISSQWLAQVLYAEADRLFGWTGVVVLAAAAAATAFGLLAHFLFDRLSVQAALVLIVAAFMLTAPHLVARPHVLALPVMVAWVAGLLGAVEQRRLPSWALLPWMTLWANLHGGFTFGLALLAPIALEAMLQASASQRIAVLLRWILFGVLALAAACITPYGPESILVTGRILGLGPALATIGEWQPQSFATLTGFGLCLLGGIGFALYRGLTLPPVRLLVVLGLLYMALSHERNAEMLGLLAPLFLAAPLGSQLNGAQRHADTAPAAGRLLAGSVLVVALAGLSVGMAFALNYRPPASVTPAEAVAAVKASGKQRIFNSYDFGGYLIHAGVKPFIDGRTELYGTDFVLRSYNAVMLNDVDGLFRLLDEHEIDVTLLNPGAPAAALLDRLQGWQRVYADEVAVVHVRTSSAAAGEIRQ